MRNRHIASAAIILAVGSFFVAQVAEASDNMYKTSNANWNCWDGTMSNGLYCQTDNATLVYHEQASVGSDAQAQVDTTLFDSYNGTALNVTWAANPVYSGTGETDIIYQVSSSGFSGTYIGMTWCNDAVSSTRCDQEYVRFRANGYVDRELACHETGHAVGLTHGVDASPAESDTAAELGCMVRPDYGTSPYLGLHNVYEINATY